MGWAAATFGLFGGLLIYWAYSDIKRVEASQSWPSTTGKVVSSRIIKKTSHYMGEPQYGGGGSSTSYDPKITYSYSIMGKSRKSSRISFGDRAGPKSKARSLVRKYSKGSSVTVYYNPDEPNDAVLERAGGGAPAKGCLGLFLLGGAIVFTIYQLTQ